MDTPPPELASLVSTIDEKYARLRKETNVDDRWLAEKDVSLARFSNAQLQLSPSGRVHNVHQVMLNDLFPNGGNLSKLTRRHPLEGLDDLVLCILYSAPLPATIPTNLEQSIKLWKWAHAVTAPRAKSLASSLVHINLWHTDVGEIAERLRDLTEDTMDVADLICIFLTFFENNNTPSSVFESILEKLADHFEHWSANKRLYRPGFELHQETPPRDPRHYVPLFELNNPAINSLVFLPLLWRTAALGVLRDEKVSCEDTFIRCGSHSLPCHAVILAPTWPFFAEKLEELPADDPNRTSTMKYQVVLPDFDVSPLTPGALTASCLRPLLYQRYHRQDLHVTPADAMLLLLQSRFYDLSNDSFLTHCQQRLASNMDATQMVDVVRTAHQLGAFHVRPAVAPAPARRAKKTRAAPQLPPVEEDAPDHPITQSRAILNRVAEITRTIHDFLPAEVSHDSLQSLTVDVRDKIEKGGYKDDEMVGAGAVAPNAPIPSLPAPVAHRPNAPPLPMQHFPFVVKTLTGKLIGLDGNPGTTIEETKLLVERREGIPSCQQRLIYAGRQLEDARDFGHYDIAPLAYLHMVLRLSGG